MVRERRLPAWQKLKDLPGGRLQLEMTVAHLDDIWPWVLSWGSEAKVIRPKALAAAITEQAGVIVKLYASRRCKAGKS